MPTLVVRYPMDSVHTLGPNAESTSYSATGTGASVVDDPTHGSAAYGTRVGWTWTRCPGIP